MTRHWLPGSLGYLARSLGRRRAVISRAVPYGLMLEGAAIFIIHPEGLWHLLTRDNKDLRERVVDLERARHLPWCAAIIQNADEPEVTCWHFRHQKDNSVRAMLWLREWDYVVILARKSKSTGVIYDLVTAYIVDYNRKREQLEESYENRLEKQEPDWDAK